MQCWALYLPNRMALLVQCLALYLPKGCGTPMARQVKRSKKLLLVQCWALYLPSRMALLVQCLAPYLPKASGIPMARQVVSSWMGLAPPLPVPANGLIVLTRSAQLFHRFPTDRLQPIPNRYLLPLPLEIRY